MLFYCSRFVTHSIATDCCFIVFLLGIVGLLCYALDMYEPSRMVVRIFFCFDYYLAALVFVGAVGAELLQQLPVVHTFQQTVGAEQEVVTGLQVGGVSDVELRLSLHTRHDGTGDDILPIIVRHLVEGQLACQKEVVGQ